MEFLPLGCLPPAASKYGTTVDIFEPIFTFAPFSRTPPPPPPLDLLLPLLLRDTHENPQTCTHEQMPTCAPEVSTKRRLLGDTLASGETKHPEKESDARLFRTRLRQMVQELPEDERTVVSLRCALDTCCFVFCS